MEEVKSGDKDDNQYAKSHLFTVGNLGDATDKESS